METFLRTSKVALRGRCFSSERLEFFGQTVTWRVPSQLLFPPLRHRHRLRRRLDLRPRLLLFFLESRCRFEGPGGS